MPIMLGMQSIRERILGKAACYRLFSRIVGKRGTRAQYVARHIRPQSGHRILDIGCGPGDILEELPVEIDYLGFDMNAQYIEEATRRFGQRAKFSCAMVEKDLLGSCEPFDIVMANGIVHHLDDGDAEALFRLAHAALKPGGRLVTLDGCYVESQSWGERLVLSRDRGAFVRTREGYEKIASTVFRDVTVTIRHDLLRIPYCHIIMECAKDAEPAG